MEWKAEVALDAAGVRALLREQFPDLAGEPVEPAGEGWDNSVFRVGGWLFRFPRREVVLRGVRTEIAVLPRLAPLLPLPVPTPERVGRPGAGYPWPFFGFRPVAGREAVGLPKAARAALGAPLGRFLRALHAPGLLAAFGPELPEDPMGRADPVRRAPRARQQLGELVALGLLPAGQIARAELHLAAAERLPPPAPSAVVHGDLHVRHLLVDAAGALAGVIDWGDLCRGDPAVDLSLYWSLLPAAGRAAFAEAYGPLPPERLLRARVLALSLNAVLARYGHLDGRAELEREALAGLERALE